MSEVFPGEDGAPRLQRLLQQAKDQGASLAVLPELPLNDWCPSSRTREEGDCELPGGPRHRALSEAAKAVGIAVLGGVIRKDPEDGRRENTALLVDSKGEVIARYAKIHLPEEEGYWETSHYEPGHRLPEPVEVAGFPVGIQICSDVNRPEASHILGAAGALAILAPRATPPVSYERWRTVLRANAVTSGTYVVSVNRPRPEPGTSIGGPSLAIGPDGSVLLETTDPLALVTLERRVVVAARQTYPGYLPLRPDLYAEGWRTVGRSSGKIPGT